MLYATLDEVYNVSSFKKAKKNKKNKQDDNDSMKNVSPFDMYEHPQQVFNSAQAEIEDRTVNDYKTTQNHCDPLQAPPYVFPVEKKAKKHFDQAIKDMNKIVDQDNTVLPVEDTDGSVKGYSNNPEQYDELDAYLDNDDSDSDANDSDYEDEKYDNVYKSSPDLKVNKNKKRENVLEKDRLYELAFLIIMAIVILIMCELIVRIAS